MAADLQADSPSSPTSGDGVVNCQFSVNQAALRTMVQPMIVDKIRESHHEERLTSLEAAIDRLWLSLEQKGDAKGLRDVVAGLQEQKQALQQKADQRSVTELKTAFARLEETSAYKADQTSVDEVADTLQRVAQIAGQKADLSYVNRTNERVQKLTHVSSQQEKQLAELYAARESLEAFRLPQTLQRTRDMLLKTSTSLKSLQDVVALKADQQGMDELVLGLKDVECSLHWKANQQSIVELNAATHEIHRQLGTKGDMLAVEELRAEIARIEEQVALKAGQQESHELGVSLQSVERVLSQKADYSSLNDARARFLALEVSVEQKADRQEVGEVSSTVSTMRDWLVRKVEQLVSDFSKRPEAEALVAAEAALERLRQVSEQKADAEVISQQFDEVTRKLEDVRTDIVKQLGRKVEQTSFEEAVEALARGMDSPARGSARSYPASTASISTTDSSIAARRSGKTLVKSNSSTPRGSRTALRPNLHRVE